MRCSDVEALWDEYRGGTEAPNEVVLAHLRRCRTCQSTYEQCEGIAYCLTCLPIVEPPASLVPRILEHIDSLRGRFRSTAPSEFSRVESPLGDLIVAWRDSSITFLGVALAHDDETSRVAVERRLRVPVRPGTVPGWVLEALAGFFTGWTVDVARVDISELSTFEQAALHAAAQIPPGEVRSYGWIAREIGHPLAARAVGQAMARNPIALLFPCHRVVDATGALHNYGYGVDVKARILQMEGYRKA